MKEIDCNSKGFKSKEILTCIDTDGKEFQALLCWLFPYGFCHRQLEEWYHHYVGIIRMPGYSDQFGYIMVDEEYVYFRWGCYWCDDNECPAEKMQPYIDSLMYALFEDDHLDTSHQGNNLRYEFKS